MGWQGGADNPKGVRGGGGGREGGGEEGGRREGRGGGYIGSLPLSIVPTL